MICGAPPLTFIHARPAFIGAGLVALYGFLTAKGFDTWTAASLAATVATGITGFRRPFGRALPPHNLAIVSLVAVARAARYIDKPAGMWCAIFVATRARASFRPFTGGVQAFRKIPPLRALAPTRSEPPFRTAQFVVLVFFIAAGFVSASRFRPASA